MSPASAIVDYETNETPSAHQQAKSRQNNVLFQLMMMLLLLSVAACAAIDPSAMSYRQLQAACKAVGLPARGKAALLRQQLRSSPAHVAPMMPSVVEAADAISRELAADASSHEETEELAEAQAALALAIAASEAHERVPEPLLPGAASTLSAGSAHREPNFVPLTLIAELRRELAALGAAGRFEVTSSFSSDGRQDDLRSAMTCRPDMASDAFAQLYERLDAVRAELGRQLGRQLTGGMEATFVIYPQGGYYRRHVDSLAGVDAAGSGSRSVSFIVYLNEPGWTAHDGGQLRIYRQDESAPVDVLPEAGSLVLFDSKLVSHEVLPTRRERACLVGWMREP